MTGLLAFIGMPGTVELLVVAGVVLLLFGNRLPGVMRSLGSSIVEFKRGIQGGDEDENADDTEHARAKEDRTEERA